MPNMSYCRFQNTYTDLQDCNEAMHDDLSETEAKYRKWLIKLCVEIAEEFGEELEEEGD